MVETLASLDLRPQEIEAASCPERVDGLPVSGDLVFTAYSRQTFTWVGVLGELVSRFAQDQPFAFGYGVLIGTVTVALGVSLVWPRRSATV